MRRCGPLLRILAATGVLSSGLVIAVGAPSDAAPSTAASLSSSAAAPLSSNFALAVGPATASNNPLEPGCQLANGVSHVFYLGFDNFHLRRDNSNSTANNGDNNYNTDLSIPSDLEQVPNLYNFLRGTTNAGTGTDTSNYADGRNTTYTDSTTYPGGTILGNDHTPLISHTSDDFTSSYTGVYGDRNGVAASQNSIAAYTGNPASPVASASGFDYWTDPLGISGDNTNTFITQGSGGAVNAPAPWVPFTRAGCDVGGVATTGFVLENSNSAKNASTPNGIQGGATAQVTYTTADEGISVHCANSGTTGQPGGICGDAETDPNVAAVPDNLPSEPGGYSNYYAMYGHRFVAPAVNDRLNSVTTGGSTTLNLLRSPATSSFPSFNSEDGNYTLGYTLAMQKAGIPITFGYLSDAHDCHYQYPISPDYNFGTNPAGESSSQTCDYYNSSGMSAAGTWSFGSGEQAYVNYLANLNTDFGLFFQQAKAAGYTTANTEFVFYSDENDHVSESTPINSTCDGVTTACAYNHSSDQPTPVAGQTGELAVNVNSLLPTSEQNTSTGQPYFVLADSAPDFYLETAGSAAAPAQNSTAARNFERALGGVTYTDPFTGNAENLVNYMADQNELSALHMITADPLRSPSLVAFAPGQDYVSTSNCSGGQAVCSNSNFNYVHGDFAPETVTNWAGVAGPGVANLGTTKVWTDHPDLRPTLLALLGLQDDYQGDGRVITQILNPGVVNAAMTTSTGTQLGTLLKELNAPVYQSSEGANDGFGTATLVADTEALESNATNDSTYSTVESDIATITGERNQVVGDIEARLASAQSGTPIDPSAAATDESNGQCLLTYANALKAYAANPATAPAPTACMIASAIVPETSHPVVLVLSAGVIFAGGLLLIGRRRRRPLVKA
jgi:hypothetical protein